MPCLVSAVKVKAENTSKIAVLGDGVVKSG
jgi:hypothetical protein